jgi:hypothetical protein
VGEGLKQIKPRTLEYVEFDRKRKYQKLARRDQIELVLFAPGGEDVKLGSKNPAFKHYCARINSAFGSPLREFPSRAILHGVYLAGANISSSSLINAKLSFVNLSGALLSGADLEGADLESANLFGANLYNTGFYAANLHGANFYGANLSSADLGEARLNGADLRSVFNLTLEQIESAWVDDLTGLPEDLEKVKPEILERQRLRTIDEIAPFSPGAEAETPEIPIA